MVKPRDVRGRSTRVITIFDVPTLSQDISKFNLSSALLDA